MEESLRALLAHRNVIAGLRQAWLDSNPGTSGGHEEGGFVVRNKKGRIQIQRWKSGDGDSVMPPPHPGCTSGGKQILASFHTHPNLSPEYFQEPLDKDRRAVSKDPDLKDPEYCGELVIANALIYWILPTGDVAVLGTHSDILV